MFVRVGNCNKHTWLDILMLIWWDWLVMTNGDWRSHIPYDFAPSIIPFRTPGEKQRDEWYIGCLVKFKKSKQNGTYIREINAYGMMCTSSKIMHHHHGQVCISNHQWLLWCSIKLCQPQWCASQGVYFRELLMMMMMMEIAGTILGVFEMNHSFESRGGQLKWQWQLFTLSSLHLLVGHTSPSPRVSPTSFSDMWECLVGFCFVHMWDVNLNISKLVLLHSSAHTHTHSLLSHHFFFPLQKI